MLITSVQNDLPTWPMFLSGYLNIFMRHLWLLRCLSLLWQLMIGTLPILLHIQTYPHHSANFIEYSLCKKGTFKPQLAQGKPKPPQRQCSNLDCYGRNLKSPCSPYPPPPTLFLDGFGSLVDSEILHPHLDSLREWLIPAEPNLILPIAGFPPGPTSPHKACSKTGQLWGPLCVRACIDVPRQDVFSSSEKPNGCFLALATFFS